VKARSHRGLAGPATSQSIKPGSGLLGRAAEFVFSVKERWGAWYCLSLELKVSFAPLAERKYRRVFVAQTVSYVGSAATPVALSFAVLDLTRSTTALGVVNAANTVPIIVFVLVGGVIGDRVRRGRLLVGSNLLLAASRTAMAILVLSGVGTTWSLGLCAATGGFANAVFLPASQAVIPQVVSEQHLREANALLRLTRNGTQVFGGALGGIAVATIGPGWALGWDAASYLIAAGLLAGLGLPTPTNSTTMRIWKDLRLGWSEFWSRTWLWGIVVQFSFVNAAYAAGFLLLGPVIALRSLGGPRGWGLVLTGLAAGSVVGGVIALRWRVRRPLFVGSLGVLTMSLPLIALASRSSLTMVVAAAAVAGIGLEQFEVGWSTVLQQQIPSDRLSKVSSYDLLGSFAFIPIGFALGGPISSEVGVDTTVWGAAAIVIVATVAVLASHQVRTMPARSPEPDSPQVTEEPT
jgi:MFS family permease